MAAGRWGWLGRATVAGATVLALAVMGGGAWALTAAVVGAHGPVATLDLQRRAGARAATQQAGSGDAMPEPASAPGPSTGFAAPYRLPGGTGAYEPSLAVDNRGTYYAVGPTGPGSTPVSPLWRSTDDGATWNGPRDPATVGSSDNPQYGGFDSDVITDNAGNVYVFSLWSDPAGVAAQVACNGVVDNTSLAVSHDQGATWTATPWGHLTICDDRPWFAYDRNNDELYADWNGSDGIHVGRASLRKTLSGAPGPVGDVGSMMFTQDVVAVSQNQVENGFLAPALPNYGNYRNCTCPPGRIVVDRHGNVFFAYMGPIDNLGARYGTFIAQSTDQGQTWSVAQIPGSDAPRPVSTGSRFSTYLVDLKADAFGNLYSAWSETVPQLGGVTGREVFYSTKTAQNSTWQKATQLTAQSLDGDMPQIAVGTSPGRVDIAYYGAANQVVGVTQTGGVAAQAVQYNLYLLQSRDGLATTPVFTEREVYANLAWGALSGAQAPGPPGVPGVGDFFSLALDPAGLAVIVTDAALTTLPDGSHGSDYGLVVMREVYARDANTLRGATVTSCAQQYGQVCQLAAPQYGGSAPGTQTGAGGNGLGPAPAGVSGNGVAPTPVPSPVRRVNALIDATRIHDPVLPSGFSPLAAAIVAAGLVVACFGATLMVRLRV